MHRRGDEADQAGTTKGSSQTGTIRGAMHPSYIRPLDLAARLSRIPRESV
jgi:hypothetical protein